MELKEYNYKINGIKFKVKVGEAVDNTVHVEVNGIPYTVELDKAPTKKSVIKQVKNPQKAPRTESGEKVITAPVETPSGGYIIKAPLPGTVTSLKVKPGDMVNAGDTVCLLEAMKMENDIHSPKAGKVKQILVNVGDSVAQDGGIMILE